MRSSRSARRAAALGLGAWLDAWLGDPPNRAHPVAVLGGLVRLAEERAPSGARDRARYGTAVAIGLPVAAALASREVVQVAARLPGGEIVVSAGLLSLATSQRTLYVRAGEVAEALERGDVERARRLLATHLVSRDTSSLDASGVAAAAIESVAENLSDGVVAPWWWFAVAGAPGAWAYRAANTLDAMWGYREEPYGELGRAAARLDDALNLAPARLTAAALLAAAGGHGVATWWRDHGRTASPNAGHPMAAMAGALGVELAKGDQYVLGTGGRAPDARDIRRAIAIARRAAIIALGVLTVASPGRGL